MANDHKYVNWMVSGAIAVAGVIGTATVAYGASAAGSNKEPI